MKTMLRIEIIDENCGEDEAYYFTVPLETSKESIISAIAVLYPTATSILMEAFVEED